jgi:hypothetical protein
MDLCRELLLPGAAAISAMLAGNQQAQEINFYIQCLIRRDAYERAQARELAFDTNIQGFDHSEYEQTYQATCQVWEGWQATDRPVREGLNQFLCCCSDAMTN